MADYKISGTDLTSVADAIRTKGGTSAGLSFPDGFVSAVQNIPSGGSATLITKSITEDGTYNAEEDEADGYSSVTVNVENANYAKGEFTCPSSGSSYTLSFGKTFSKYVAVIEMTDSSKTALVNSGLTAARTFAMMLIYPKLAIGNMENNYQAIFHRFNPSNNVMDNGAPTTCTFTSSSITIPMGTTSSANQLYQNYSYKYYVAEIE